MQRISIVELKEKEPVESVFLVSEKHMGLGKNGKPFLSLKLSDQTGAIDARVWDRVEDLAPLFELGQLIRVKAQVQIFQNRKQLIISKLERFEDPSLAVEDFLPKAATDPTVSFTKLILLVKTLKNPHIQQLILNTLEDPEIKPKFLRAPAAKTIHHAWLGGLLEHVLSICQIMEFVAQHYSFLNRDLLFFGAIFHDIGKIWELEVDNGIQYTEKGRLLGHMLLGCELVDKKASRILGFPEDLKDLCKHIILSHHGQLDYGSPKRPKFLEAYIVAMVDDFDSKINTIHSLISLERGQTTEKWSRYSELFDRYFLLEDLKTKYES